LAQSLTSKNTYVIPTETIPQGIAAMIEFIPEADYETNIKQMAESLTCVKTIEVTRSTRAARINGLSIEPGQIIALLDGELKVAAENSAEAIFRALSMIDLAGCRVITLYYGKDTNELDATVINSQIANEYSHISAGIVNGGQPDYLYIVSVE
ncbi:MAG: DAK2 domain-containing protein, partial [Dehalococcoidales bacterium]